MSQAPVTQYTIPLEFDAAEKALRDALQAQGFGVLTEVDVTSVLRAKLGVEIPRHKLLGACNPVLANASLAAAPEVGAFLPCGVSIRAGETEGSTIAAVQNPALLGELFGVPALEQPANEAADRLDKALRTVGTPR